MSEPSFADGNAEVLALIEADERRAAAADQEILDVLGGKKKLVRRPRPTRPAEAEPSFADGMARLAAHAARCGYAAELVVALREARGDDAKIDALIERLCRDAQARPARRGRAGRAR